MICKHEAEYIKENSADYLNNVKNSVLPHRIETSLGTFLFYQKENRTIVFEGQKQVGELYL